jgi:hypothetical protein
MVELPIIGLRHGRRRHGDAGKKGEGGGGQFLHGRFPIHAAGFGPMMSDHERPDMNGG